MPSARAWANTWRTGTITRTPRTVTAARVSPQRTRTGSRRAVPTGPVPPSATRPGRTISSTRAGAASAVAASTCILLAPALKEVDQYQQDERDDQQHDGQRRRLGGPVVGVLQQFHNQDRSDLGFLALVGRDEHHRPILAQGA